MDLVMSSKDTLKVELLRNLAFRVDSDCNPFLIVQNGSSNVTGFRYIHTANNLKLFWSFRLVIWSPVVMHIGIYIW